MILVHPPKDIHIFEEVNKTLTGELSISWREIEPGCELFYVHDENDFFPEECYVTACGEKFEDCEGRIPPLATPSSCGVIRPAYPKTAEPNRKWWTSSMATSMRMMTHTSTSIQSPLADKEGSIWLQ